MHGNGKHKHDRREWIRGDKSFVLVAVGVVPFVGVPDEPVRLVLPQLAVRLAFRKLRQLEAPSRGVVMLPLACLRGGQQRVSRVAVAFPAEERLQHEQLQRAAPVSSTACLCTRLLAARACRMRTERNPTQKRIPAAESSSCRSLAAERSSIWTRASGNRWANPPPRNTAPLKQLSAPEENTLLSKP
eukprot:scaffold340_cov256-Pinguiococcus_pyrenoidosus.AAC.41